jgi:hypothetical protein
LGRPDQPATEDILTRAFLSYSRKDESAVSAVEHDLKEFGLDIWIDRELTGGQAWWDLILRQIRDCECFLFGLSPDSLKSEACLRELNYAAVLAKPILPLLLTDGVATKLLPSVLSTIQFVDYRRADKQAFIALTKALARLPAPPALPEPLPEPPAVPISYLSSLSERIRTSQTLSIDQQSVLLVELRTALRNQEDLEELRQLMQEFRRRGDLLASVAQEIDELSAAQAGIAQAPRSRPANREPEPAPAASEAALQSGEVVAIHDASQRVTELVTLLQPDGPCWEVRADRETRVVLRVRGGYCVARVHYNAYIDLKLNKLRGMGWQLDLARIIGDIAVSALIFLTFGLALFNGRARSRFRSKSATRSWKLNAGAGSAFEIAQTVVSALQALAPVTANLTLAETAEKSTETGWQSFLPGR